MTSTQTKYSHLPLLYNPLLNCLFNNPSHQKPTYKQTIQELANFNDYTILVPPSYILQDGYDPATTGSSNKVYLKEMCYSNEDFIRSHIIRSNLSILNNSASNTRNQLVVFHTINGKQILIKNGMIFTGKGFKKSLRLSILGYSVFNSFCDYFPKGCKFTLIHIEDTLFGSNFDRIIDYMNPQFLPITASSQNIKEIKPAVINTSSIADREKNSNPITFEMLLRSLPLLSKSVSENYYKLFHHNNIEFRKLRTHNRKKLLEIKDEFHKMVELAYKIMLDSIKPDSPDGQQILDLIHSVLNKHPGLDLNKLVYEYVELNLYDKVWSQLVFQFNYDDNLKSQSDPDAIKVLDGDKYKTLSCLSLNQLEVPIEVPWHMNTVLRRISVAIEEFTQLSDSSITNQTLKRKVITNTIAILTGSSDNLEVNSVVDFNNEKANNKEELIIDADTLLGMLIMVIVHTKIDNLEAHLYYLKNFSPTDLSNDGYFNYILSNLDAVIYHLSSDNYEESHYQNLIHSSQLNYELWSCIQKQDHEKLMTILENINTTTPNGDLKNDHFLKSRNINGESCLMFAIKVKDSFIFNNLLEYNMKWFSIDDILFDKNTTTDQTLLIASVINEATDISVQLVETITTCASFEEQIAYFNHVDIYGRSVGHYLFHDLVIMNKIGHLINWELLDANGHTPLFSICRCYDHHDYTTIITNVFKIVYQRFKENINFDKHIDKNGNTLLHVVLRGLKESELLSPERKNLININQLNKKSMVPLTLYVKYNRLSNLQELLMHSRLDFLLEEPKNYYNVFDYLSFLANKPTPKSKELMLIESTIHHHFLNNFFPNSKYQKIIALNSKYDTQSNDWVIFFRIFKDDKEISTFESLTELKQMLNLFGLQNPLIAFPNKEKLFGYFPVETVQVAGFSKFKINRLIESINLYFKVLNMYSMEKDLQMEFIKNYRHNSNELTFDTIKHINSKEEQRRLEKGEVKLTKNHIIEIETFLLYSLEDLKNYKFSLTRLNKLMSVYDIKRGDFRIVNDRLISKLIGNDPFFKSPQDIKFEWHGEEKQDDLSYKRLYDCFMWIELSMMELINNIYKILDKLNQWKKTFDKINRINHELTKVENKANPDNGNQEGSNRDSSSTNTNTTTTSNDPIAITTSISPPTSPTTSTASSFFSFGIENKRSRYKRLLMVKAEEVKLIMDLNSEIKLDHELIASEISKFLKFRSNFINYSIKQFTTEQLSTLQNRHYELKAFYSSLH